MPYSQNQAAAELGISRQTLRCTLGALYAAEHGGLTDETLAQVKRYLNGDKPAPSASYAAKTASCETWYTRANYERSVFLSDIHVPYHDGAAVDIALNFIRWFEPQHVWLVGDIIDFYQFSKFDQDPKRTLRTQDDIDKAVEFLDALRCVAPTAAITYIEGNHEYRLHRYLCKHPEISMLKALDMRNLLRLSEFDIPYRTSNETVMFHNFCIEHGEIVRKFSGYTARGQMEKRGVSGLSGHTHRMGTHYHTNMAGDFCWTENGCLCDRQPEYVKSPNWQQGFSIGHYEPGGERFAIEQVCITNGKAVFAGREFTA